ncbi:ribonuclease D [Aliikangiella sp. IMCC44359]|uniref:ribonuclease D n=1 Tax=Aliikangiella sp. IMCC44359 TaxID=3459125 RepID=UPI00403AC043
MQMSNYPDVKWVDSQREFNSIVQSWINTKYLAIDTEFERRTTYYPILALLQIFDGDKVYLFDPLKIECTDAFRSICENANIIKIMHSAKEDLEVFFYSWNCRFNGLFDTQVAFAFDSGEISVGYAALVEQLCNESLSKEETQSNWLARPLSKTQLDYAAKDVIYLPGLYQKLNAKLVIKPYLKWFQYECDEMCDYALHQPDYKFDYRQAKDVWRLNGEQLGLFKLLYQWREETAIKENRTRNHIVRDPQLVQLVVLMPQIKNDFYKVKDLHPKSIRLYSEAIIEIVNGFKSANNAPLITVPNPRDLPYFNQLSHSFTKAIEGVAKSNQITANVLASKRLTRKLAFSYLAKEAFPNVWSGWRAKLLKPQFDQIFSQLKTS